MVGAGIQLLAKLPIVSFLPQIACSFLCTQPAASTCTNNYSDYTADGAADNESNIKIAHLGGSLRSRYFARRAERLGDRIERELMTASYCQTKVMLADIFITSGKYDLAQELCKRCLGFDKSCAKLLVLMRESSRNVER